MPRYDLRNCSTAELNRFLADAESMAPDDREAHAGDLDAILAEKDRRLADPNSNDFRPQFN